jgi:hypothetical protein
MTNERTSNPSTAITLSIGSLVVSADGEELGTIATVAGDQFKIDVSGARDFWLDVRTVLKADEHQADLAYDSVQLEEFKLDSAGATSGSPRLAEQVETFSTEAEQVRKRRDMERGHG